MQNPTNPPIPHNGPIEQPERAQTPANEKDFAELHDDPQQAEELERQQDA